MKNTYKQELYIRKLGTKRWLRFKELEDWCDQSYKMYDSSEFWSWENPSNIVSSAESYHENNSVENYQVYEVTNKEITVQVEVDLVMIPSYQGKMVQT